MLRHKRLNSYRRSVARARLFFYRYGFLSVLIGRFLGPLRCFVPTVAGVMGMPEWRFQLANIISAVLWVPALLAPGYLAAISVDSVKHGQHSTTYSLIGIVVLGALIWLVLAKRKDIKNKQAAARRIVRHNAP